MATNYNPQIVTDGLVLYLDAANSKSYPGSGTTWTNLSGNGNNGILTNGPTYNGNNLGNFSFDGSNDYVQLGSSVDLIPNVSAITVTAIFRPNTTGSYRKIITTAASTTNVTGFSLSLGNSASIGVYFGVRIGSTNYSVFHNQYLTTSKYSIVTGVYDSSFLKIYVNGTLSNQVSRTGTINRGTGTARISGYGNNAELFNGDLSSCSIYNRALSADEIKQNFNALRGRYGI